MRSYHNATIFCGADLQPLEGKTILVDGDRIEKITNEVFENSIDLRGGYVIPAFLNGHCHLGDTGAKELGVGLTLEAAVVPPDGLKHQYLRSIDREQLVSTIRDGLREMLRNGIAVCADFREGGAEGVLALREAQKGLPIRALALSRPLADCTADAALSERELAQLLEISDGFGISGVNAFDLPTLQKMRELAKDHFVAIHIAESPIDAKNSLTRFGRSEVERALEFEPDLMVHLTHAADYDLELLQARGQRVVCCPRTNCILGDGVPPLDRLEEAGVCWGLGSDNMMFTSPDLFREMDLGSRMIRGHRQKPDCLSAHALLRAATVQGARALKLEERFGTVEEGKSATFLVLRADSPNFRYSHDLLSSVIHRAGPAEIDYFLCAGAEVIKDGIFLL